MTDDDIDQKAVDKATVAVMGAITFLTPAEKRIVFARTDRLFNRDGTLTPLGAEIVTEAAKMDQGMREMAKPRFWVPKI